MARKSPIVKSESRTWPERVVASKPLTAINKADIARTRREVPEAPVMLLRRSEWYRHRSHIRCL
jgi:hypothetical protein